MKQKISLSWNFIIGFFALSFFLVEMHEVVHTNVGYLFGGCYGARDFNVWGLCEASKAHPYSYWATLSGPIFTFLVMWFGYLIAKKDGLENKSLGLAILFASMPFGRIFTVLLKGGDEYFVMRNLFNEGAHDTTLWLMASVIIIGICYIPLAGAYKLLPEKKRLLTFLALFLGPTFISILVILLGLNSLLIEGLLDGPGILGQPLFITLWFVLCFGLFYWKRKSLKGWIIPS